MSNWSVYLLLCQGGSYYTGISTDVDRRFKAHQKGRGARYTRSHPPIGVRTLESNLSRSDASILEYKIKALTHLQKQRMFEGQDTGYGEKP